MDEEMPLAAETKAPESSSESEDDEEDVLSPEEVARVEAAEEPRAGAAGPPPKTRNEQDAPAPEAPAVQTLLPSDELSPAGTVLNVIGDTLIVAGVPDGPACSEGSVLCTADRAVLGAVGETFGPVALPHYKVALAASAVDGDARPAEGAPVFSVRQYASFVEPAAIRSKGSDASNVYDEEVAAEEQEFSDDEAEQAARARHYGGQAWPQQMSQQMHMQMPQQQQMPPQQHMQMPPQMQMPMQMQMTPQQQMQMQMQMRMQMQYAQQYAQQQAYYQQQQQQYYNPYPGQQPPPGPPGPPNL